MEHQGRTVEKELARMAGRAHGVVTRRQLLDAGITRQEIRDRLETGVLLREYRACTASATVRPSVEARYLAAVLACGEGALLCGTAAGHLLGLQRGPAPPPHVVTRSERRIEGVITRRSRRGDPADGIMWRGVPVTTVARTLVDLASELSRDALARACHEAGVRHGTTPAQVEAVLAHRPSSPGAKKLRRVLRGDVKVTLSALERRFLALLRQAGLMLPETNRVAGGRRVDARWPDLRLTVEVDGYRYHRSRHAWERDRRREREARARGDEFRRYTYGDVFDDPRLMLAELRALVTPAPRSEPTAPPSRPPRTRSSPASRPRPRRARPA